MARMTNAELVYELRKVANMDGFDNMDHEGDHVRDVTRLYRETWLKPLIDLVEQRLCRQRNQPAMDELDIEAEPLRET